MKENRINEDDTPEEIERKTLYAKLCADKKPYFFCYNYSSLKVEYDKFVKSADSNTTSMYRKTFNELMEAYKDGTIIDPGEFEFVQKMHKWLPLDMSKSTMNRICWAIEKEFDNVQILDGESFDYSILRGEECCDIEIFETIKSICELYKSTLQVVNRNIATSDNDDASQKLQCILNAITEGLYEQCPNENMLCDILIDICYKNKTAKQLMWVACGEVIIERLLKRSDNLISYPQKDEDGDFWCQGTCYSMRNVVVGGETIEGI